MATLTNSQRLREARKKREEESQGSSSQSSYGNYKNSDRLQMRSLERSIGLDTFESDLTNLGTTVQGIYSDWQSPETMTSTKASVESMMKRINDYQTYQSKYGNADSSNINDLLGGYQSVLDDWDTLTNTYGYYQNADAFNAARKKSQMDEQFKGLTYDEVQEQLKQYDKDSDEYKYLSEYMGYTDLKDFDKAIEAYKAPYDASAKREELQSKYPNVSQEDILERMKEAKTSVANGSAITYKSADGQDDYLKRLETARNQYALDNTFDLYKHYLNAEDFEWKSQYKEADYNGLWDRLSNEGKDVYEYVGYIYSLPEESRDMLKVKGGGFAGFGQMPSGIENMTEEEMKTFFYIANQEGYDKGLEFIKDMEVTLSKRGTDETNQREKEWLESGNAFERRLKQGVMSTLSVPNALVGKLEGAVDDATNILTGDEINPYNASHARMNSAMNVQETTRDNIAEYTEANDWVGTDMPIIGNAWTFGYDTALSIGESATGIGAVGKAYSVLAGVGAFSARAKELKEEGASDEQIIVGSMASGAMEWLGEHIGVDNLFKIKNADSLGNILKSVRNQMIAEAGEEAFTEFGNIVIDLANRGTISDTYQMYQEYIDRGFSESEAWDKTLLDLGKQVASAGIGGALSGGVMGGTYSTVQYSDFANTGKQIKSNDRVQEMMDMYDTMEMQGLTPEESEALKLYAEYGQKGVNADTISNAQLGNLYQTSLREADATTKSKTATEAQKTDANKRLGNLAVIATSKPIDERARQQRVESLNKGETTAVNGNEAKIEGIRIDEGDTIVLTSEGEVKADDMTFSTNDAEILSYAENMSEEKANLLLSQYDGKADVDSYVKSFNLAYAYGETGFGAESVLKNKGVLTESQASEIYKNAVLNRANEQQKAIDEINAKHAKTTVLKGKFDDSIIDYSGKSKDGSKVNWKKLDSRQRSAVVFAKAFSKATGVNITFVTSKEVIDEDGNKTRIGKNGSYNPSTNTIEIDVYAGIDAKHVNDSIIPTLSHEMTHWMKAKAPAMYSKMTEYISETLVADGKTTMDKLVDDEMNNMKVRHPEMNVTAEMAIDELVARASEDMLSNSDTARKLLNRMSENEKKSFINKVKDTFKNLIEWVNDLLGQYKSESAEAKVLRQYKDRLKELSKMWDKALMEAVQTNQSLQKEGITGEEAINAITEKVGITVDMEIESAAPTEQLSERTWTESEYVQNRKVAISSLSKALGVSEKKASKYVDAINSVARLIADDRARLDYDPNIDENASVLKPNSDYKWSIDMSTLCAKRLLFTGTFDEIQKMLPNTALDSDDIVKIRKMMMDKGYQVACGPCYVESTRREIGTITKDFIERYKIAQKTGKPIARVNSSGKEVDLVESGTKAKFYAEEGYTPTLAELNTTDIDLVKRDHPSVYGAYLSFMNARGQAKPKLLETRAEYKGEIANKFKRKKNGELNSSTISMNESGGLRLQSFSDFEIAHLIDMMQVVMDMSEVGLTSQAYTKVPEFAEVFGDTGAKINLSLIAKGSGLDENGELIFDDVEGIDHKKAFALRDKFSKNVGTIIIGKNDAHIIKAMADSRIDYIIPFHKSSWRESLYDALGLTGYDDYTDTQHEKAIDANRKIKDFMPSEYWDFSKSGNENAQIYLEKCKADGRIPKFPQFQGYDGYWKLLIDFKMYDNNGVGSPQTQVMPNFNMEAANRILNEYEGGHRSFPVAKDIVDEFVADYKKGHPQEQYSDRDSKGTQLSAQQQKYFKDSKVRDENGNLRVVYHGTYENFTVFKANPFATEKSGLTRVKGYFSEDESFSKSYGETQPYYLNIKNPLIIDGGQKTIEEWEDFFHERGVMDVRLDSGIAESTLIGGNFNGKTYYFPWEIIDIASEYWKGDGNVTEMIEKAGYDGIWWDYDEKAWMPFNANQIKLTTNTNPTDDADIRYSDRDSEGTQLTSGQIEFFKDAKLRDENGSLKVMYHGTERGGFTVFNRDFSDDGRSLFFTDSPMVAKGYSGTYDEIIPGKKLSVDEMTDIINDSYLWVEYDNGEYQIVHNKYGEFVVEYSNKDYDEFVEYLTEEYGSNEPSGNYKVYLNLKNPLVVDAQGRNWDDLPISQTKNVNRYNYIYITKGVDGKYNVEWEDMMNKYGDAETAELTFAEIKSKFGEYVADEIKHGRASIENIIIDSRNKELIPRTTRQYSYYAEKRGYDGVIIEDVLDTAIYASGKEKYQTSTVAIAFNPNQVKSVANTNPTENDDMRYSDRKSVTDWLIGSIDDYLADLSVEDLVDEVSDDSNTNVETPKVERAKRRVDEVNKRLEEIGLSFNGTKSLAWTDERIDKYLSGGYYGSSNPNYAQAYITYMTPQQFLNLTVGSKLHTVDMIQNESEAYGEVDLEKLGNSSPIFLDIEEGRVWTKVTGHEGRHRMYLLGKAGVERVPVLLFDYQTKYNKTAKEEMKLIAQRYNDTELVSKSRNVVINNVIPFSQGNRDLIVEKFGSGNENADIRYADREGNTASFNGKAFWSGSVSLIDGVIEEVHTYAEAENADFHHTLYFSPEQIDKMDGEENAFFCVDKGKIEIWRDEIPSNIISEIKKQIIIFDDNQYADREIDSRTLLTNALESVVQNDEEREKLTNYKEKIERVNSYQFKLDTIRSQIKELYGTGNDNRIEKLREEASELEKKIDYYDRQLLKLEATEPLKQVVSRARRVSRQKGVASYKEQIEKKAKIQSITQKALVMNKWLVNPSNKEHIHESMRPVVAHLLKAIDFSSKQYLGMRGGIQKGMPTRSDISLAQALADVQKMVTKAEVDGDILYELYGSDMMEDMEVLVDSVNLYMRNYGDNEYVLNQMTLDQLVTLDKLVSTIKSSVTQMNKFHAVNTRKSISATAQEGINYMNSLGQAKLHKGKFASNMSQMLNWGNATPYYAFKRFGEGGMKVYEALQDGWDTFAFHIKKIIDYAEKTYSSEDVKRWSEEVHEFDILLPATEEERNDPKFKGNHKTIQMTTAQMMSLYCLQKREQAKGHIGGGGIRISNFTTKDGVVEQSEGVVLMEKEVDKIINELMKDKDAVAVADKLQKFMNEDCTEWGNEISMKRFGYKAFGEENYFPIQSDDNVTGDGEVKEKEKSLYRLLNMSFTKSLVKKANNRIVVDNIFDVFAQHTSEMAKYNALALPVLDAARWFNYKEKGAKVDTHFNTNSLKTAMEKAFGKDAKNYVSTFLQDINGADNVGRDRIAKGFMKNAKIASVGFNAKVVALQPTSYLRASAVIDNKYLVQALSKKPKPSMAEKWCGMAQWKALGFIDINVQRGVADLIKHDKSKMDTMTEWSMKGAEIADKVTMGYLWNACEAEIKDKHPNLAVGSDEYYKAIGKRLRDIIYATQVVDSTMTRSQMMRSTDGWDKVLTNFASEPTLSYNMLMDAYYDYKLTERQTGNKSMALKANGKKLARTMYAYTITSVITALLELGFEIFRDDEEMSPEEMMKMYLENVYLNMSIINKIPYAKEAISLLQGFTSNRMDTQWMQYFSYAAKGWGKMLSGEGNAYKTLQNTIKGFSYGFGIPIHNLTRDIKAVLDKMGILTEEELEDMFNETIGEAFPSLKTK